MKPTRNATNTIADIATNTRLREASGRVDIPAEDWLTSFLYELMRDAAPPGEVERIVRHIEQEPRDGDNLYSNGWLAHYAKNLADRLRSVGKEGDDVQHGVGAATTER